MNINLISHHHKEGNKSSAFRFQLKQAFVATRPSTLQQNELTPEASSAISINLVGVAIQRIENEKLQKQGFILIPQDVELDISQQVRTNHQRVPRIPYISLLVGASEIDFS